ncbi:unnamed protein product [Schistosoma turkestanicum]|nr:unnamed protein product [Schistosoma turkestanicum]
MGLVESKVSTFVSSNCTPEYNKSVGEESRELFLKNSEICKQELVSRKCNHISIDNQGNNSLKKQIILWKTVNATNKPNKTYYLVDDSFDCKQESLPSSSLTNDLQVFDDTSHSNQIKKQVPVSQLIRQPLLSKISPSTTNIYNMDLNNGKCQVLTTKLTKSLHYQQTFTTNSMYPEATDEWSDMLEKHSHPCLTNRICVPQSSIVSSEKTGLLQKDMIEF